MCIAVPGFQSAVTLHPALHAEYHDAPLVGDHLQNLVAEAIRVGRAQRDKQHVAISDGVEVAELNVA